MSGIFGIWNPNGEPVDRDALQTMQEAMAFWGPDGGGLWCDGAIGLGHLSMQETAESLHERQPYSDPQRPQYVVTADARLDNRDELADALGIDRARCSTLADSALILRAYQRWGGDCVDRLLGAFAFVIWDNHRRELFCARDHIGFRPFYYYATDRQFVFATDVKAVLAAPGVPRRLDDEALLAHYVRHRRLLKERSFFHHIFKLPPAHVMTVRPGTVEKRCWWRPQGQPAIRLPTNDDYAQALREQMQQAVGCRLRSEHPIGSHLSGGLDSSAVTVLAARQLRAGGRSLARAYSWSPPPDSGSGNAGAATDERDRIRLICDQEQLQCHYTELSPDDVLAIMYRDVSIEPCETMQHEQVVCRQAADHGVRVMLSGWGGDEFAAFNGRGFFAEQLLCGRWRKLLDESRLRVGIHGGSVRRDLLRRAGLPLVPDWCFALLGRDTSVDARRLRKRRGAELPRLGRGAERLLRLNWRALRERPGVRRAQLALLDHGHLTYRLEAWAHLGARHRVAYRYPFLDRRLIEFSLGLPAEMFFQQGWKRFLFRYATQDILPDALRWNKDKLDPALFEAVRTARQHALQSLDTDAEDQGPVSPHVRQSIQLARAILS